MTSTCLCPLDGNLVSRRVFLGKNSAGTVLDTETAVCHTRTSNWREKKRHEKKKVERKEKRNLTKAVLTGRKKATHVVLVKSQIKQKRQ